MIFVDRVSAYPNRYALTTEDGSQHIVTLERADNPITEGTPLNAETFNSYFDGRLAEYTQDEFFPQCYYRLVDGEQEWLNPPMQSGVEYRTSEHYMGKPVYTKLLSYITPPDWGGTKTVPIGVDGIGNIVGFTGKLENYALGYTFSLPFSLWGFGDILNVYVADRQNLVLSTADVDKERADEYLDIDGCAVYIVVKYTK